MAVRRKQIRQIVEELLEENKVKEPPVNVEKIAEACGLSIVSRDVESISGFIIRKDGKAVAKKTYVEPGVTDNNLTEVVSGLNAGMQVVSEGYNQIVDGTVISIN